MAVVTGSGGGTGGTTAFFSSFLATTNKAAPGQPVSGSVAGTVGAHTLSTPEIASHSHPLNRRIGNPTPGQPISTPFGPQPSNTNATTNATGGGGSHTHPFSGSLSSTTADVTIPAADVKYANVIIAAKD